MDFVYFFLFAYIGANIWQLTISFKYSIGWGIACLLLPFADLIFAAEVIEGRRPLLLKCIIVLSFFATIQSENVQNAYLDYSTDSELIMNRNSTSNLRKIYHPEIKNSLGLMSNSCYGKNDNSEEEKIKNAENTKTAIDKFYFPLILNDNPIYTTVYNALQTESKNKPVDLPNIDIIIRTGKYMTLEDTPTGIKEFESISGLNYEFNLKKKKTETDLLKDCFPSINNDNYILIDIDQEKPSLTESILYFAAFLILILLSGYGLYRNFI